MCGGGGADPIEYTPEMKEQIQIAVEQWNIGKDFDPVMDEYRSRVKSQGSEAATDFVQGKASLNTNRAYGDAVKHAKQSNYAAGVDPSSGRGLSSDDGMYQGLAEASSSNLSNVAFEKDTQQLVSEENLINIGMGKAGSATQGLNEIAGLSTQTAISDARNDFNEHAASSQALGTAAGLAGSAYMNSGDSDD